MHEQAGKLDTGFQDIAEAAPALLAAALRPALAARLGREVRIDRRTGDNGAIAAHFVADAEPDGDTVFIATLGTHAIAPLREAVKITNQPLISVLLSHALIATEDPANFAEAEQVLRVAVQRDR